MFRVSVPPSACRRFSASSCSASKGCPPRDDKWCCSRWERRVWRRRIGRPRCDGAATSAQARRRRVERPLRRIAEAFHVILPREHSDLRVYHTSAGSKVQLARDAWVRPNTLARAPRSALRCRAHDEQQSPTCAGPSKLDGKGGSAEAVAAYRQVLAGEPAIAKFCTFGHRLQGWATRSRRRE